MFILLRKILSAFAKFACAMEYSAFSEDLHFLENDVQFHEKKFPQKVHKYKNYNSIVFTTKKL